MSDHKRSLEDNGWTARVNDIDPGPVDPAKVDEKAQAEAREALRKSTPGPMRKSK